MGTAGTSDLHGCEEARIELGLRPVGDEQDDEVALGDDLKGLAEGAIGLREACRAAAEGAI